MTDLKGSQTEKHLKEALIRDALANRLYLYFAAKADVEGLPEASAIFRSTAEGETGHAHGNLEYLESTGHPQTAAPIGSTRENLRAALIVELQEATQIFPAWAATARQEGFTEIADWFDTLARAEQAHATRFSKLLESLPGD